MPAQPVPWDASPHTKAKHALYRRYLQKWMPIMVQGFHGNITYAEGFSGPGVYTDGSAGSPVIALRSLVDDPSIRTKIRNGVRFVFVDHDQRSINMLPGELAKAAGRVPYDKLADHGVHITVEKGECEPTLVQVLTRVGAWKRPILAVLDTWGSAVSFDLVKRIAENPSSEVIITMQPRFFARFAGADSVTHGDKVFGGRAWRAVADQAPAVKQRWLLEHYRDSIKAAGFDHVLDFELVDLRGQSLFLVFGSNNDRGLQKMKEAMWEVDAIAGMGYRDPRDPEAEMLAIAVEPQTTALRRLIADHLTGRPGREATMFELRRFTLLQTIYKESQATAVVREMIADGTLRAIDRPLAASRQRIGLPTG